MAYWLGFCWWLPWCWCRQFVHMPTCYARFRVQELLWRFHQKSSTRNLANLLIQASVVLMWCGWMDSPLRQVPRSLIQPAIRRCLFLWRCLSTGHTSSCGGLSRMSMATLSGGHTHSLLASQCLQMSRYSRLASIPALWQGYRGDFSLLE